MIFAYISSYRIDIEQVVNAGEEKEQEGEQDQGKQEQKQEKVENGGRGRRS